MKNIPSIKTLAQLSEEHAPLIRRILEADRATLEDMMIGGGYPVTKSWYDRCHHPLERKVTKLSMISELIGGFGVEYIAPGSNAKSPSIDYINTGDGYNLTLMFVRGGYKVGCWADIVESGNYDSECNYLVRGMFAR